MAEKHLEAELCRRVKALGGLAIKLDASTYGGIPDRLVVLPGRIAFVELKFGTKGRLNCRQLLWKKLLARLSAPYYVITTSIELDLFLSGE